MAGQSVLADSLSAITYVAVRTVRDDSGLIIDSQTDCDFPCFGNNDDRVDATTVCG